MSRLTPHGESSCEVIAEAGINHNGDLGTAKELIDVAIEAEADTIKFQTFQTEEIVTCDTERTEYQKRSGDTSQHEMLSEVELSEQEHEELAEYCAERDIEFLSTPYDLESVEILERIGVERYKIASADIINKPLLQAVADTGKPIILSTGMADLGEIERAVEFLSESNCPSVVLLHCVSCYPVDLENLNLRFMDTLERAFDLPVGFSDHTLDTTIPVLAAGKGAAVVEKHFTLDRSMSGPDHAASLEPTELSDMVDKMRNAETALGDGAVRHPECEVQNRPAMRRSLHARHDLDSGDEITKSDLLITRPADGISPWEADEVVGRVTTADIKQHEPMRWSELE
jgi:N-acetylneuraminate synthase